MSADLSPARREHDPDFRRMEHASLELREFEGGDAEYRILFKQEAYDAIIAHGLTNTEVELCGVLVGKAYRDGDGPYLLVSHAIRAREAREESSQVTFTHSSWDYIHRQIDEHFADLSIVGWYHMHPGYGIFLSEADRFVHRHFFDAPWQVAVVVDPKVVQMGLFFWEDGQIVRARRYWVGDRQHWEPAERLPCSVPPGTGRGRPADACSRPGADLAPEAVRAPPAAWAGPITVVLLLLCLIAAWFALYPVLNYTRPAGQREGLSEASAGELRNSDLELARLLALSARERLERGTPPEKLVSSFMEILRLDPTHRGAYVEFLPELARLAAERAKAEAQK